MSKSKTKTVAVKSKTSNGNGNKKLSCTAETSLTKEQMLEMYRFVKMTRMFDEKTVAMKRQSKIVGGVFSSLGQEATAVGTAYALEPQDFIAPLIRDIGAVLVKGIEPRHIFASYMARGAAPNRATDLQFHFADFEKGFIGPISHLGDMIPVLAGILLASKMKKERRVGVAYVGDGTTSTGTFHEGVNFAAVQKLPLITVIENNGYAYSTPTRLQSACAEFVDKAIGYGIKGFSVDGNDIIGCYETMKKAIERARNGESILIEAKTYRRKGHAEHDNQSYCPEGEIDFWAANNDPINRYEQFLLENKIADRGKLDEIASEITIFLNAEADWAESSPAPDPETAAYNVFDNSIAPPAFKHKIFGGN
jgi:pyruvate dehydrogenase E1 component alpha subunit/2-oxoisovalerate dehydrogenase E1 component alpha subunit